MDSRSSNKPVIGGRSIYAPFDRGSEYSGIQEITPVSTTAGSGDDRIVDVTSHVPYLIAGDIRAMGWSDMVDTLFIHPFKFSDRDTIYVYRTFWEDTADGREKVVSAWSKWTFPLDVTHIFTVDHYLYILFFDNDNDLLHLSRIDLRDGIVEADGWDWRLLLDFRMDMDHDDIVAAFAGGDTTITLPFMWDNDTHPLWVIDKSDLSVLTPDSIDDTTGEVVFTGADLTSEDLLFGLQYDALIHFTSPVVRQGRGENSVPLPDGDLYLLFWSVNYAKSGRVRCKVFNHGKEREYTVPISLPKEGGLKDGKFKFPVRANARDKTLTIELLNNTPYPSNFINAGWEGNFVHRSR
jgi:hypothetical protein